MIKKTDGNRKSVSATKKSAKSGKATPESNPKPAACGKPNNINFEIENIEFLLQQTLSHWKENLDSENIKADTIGDLEKLIKLRLLLIDENEQKRVTAEKMMIAVIDIIKEVIEDTALRIKLLNRLKEIEISD